MIARGARALDQGALAPPGILSLVHFRAPKRGFLVATGAIYAAMLVASVVSLVVRARTMDGRAPSGR